MHRQSPHPAQAHSPVARTPAVVVGCGLHNFSSVPHERTQRCVHARRNSTNHVETWHARYHRRVGASKIYQKCTVTNGESRRPWEPITPHDGGAAADSNSSTADDVTANIAAAVIQADIHTAKRQRRGGRQAGRQATSNTPYVLALGRRGAGAGALRTPQSSPKRVRHDVFVLLLLYKLLVGVLHGERKSCAYVCI